MRPRPIPMLVPWQVVIAGAAARWRRPAAAPACRSPSANCTSCSNSEGEWRMRNDPLLATMAGDHRFDNQVPKASSADEQMDASRRSAAGVHPRRSAGAREPVGALPVLEQQIDGFIRAESFALTGLKEQD